MALYSRRGSLWYQRHARFSVLDAISQRVQFRPQFIRPFEIFCGSRPLALSLEQHDLFREYILASLSELAL